MKPHIIINLINFLLSLSVTILYTYKKCDSLFICTFFFLGLLYFNKLLIEQAFINYGKSVK